MSEQGQAYSRAVTLQSAVSATGNGTDFDVKGMALAAVQVKGTFSATVAFQGSVDDGTTFVAIEAINRNDGTKATSTTAAGIFVVPVAGLSFLRCPVTWTSGTSVTVVARGVTVASEALGDIAVSSVTADTELPAAAALADNTATPTAPAVGAFGMVYDGATWDFMRGTAADGVQVNSELAAAVAAGDSMSNPTTAPVIAHLASWSGATWQRLQSPGGDSHSGTSLLGIGNMMWGIAAGVWERWRNNGTATVLASAARTATNQSADQTNYNWRGLHLIINVTAIVDTPSVVFTIQGKDPISANYYTILASAAIVGTGTTVLKVYPGITAAANLSVSDILPRVWRVDATHADADSATYSIAAVLIL